MSFVHVVGSWSDCSVECGDHAGVQTRHVTCTVPGEGWTLDVNQSYCDEASVRTPIRERDCDPVCPHWKTAEWRQVHFCSVL